jgi:hypothetical protein
MSVENIKALTLEYNNLATVLETQGESKDLNTLIENCNVRIGLFLNLYNLEKKLKDNFETEVKKQGILQEAELRDNLKSFDKTKPEEKMEYIEEYYTNNLIQLEGKEELNIYVGRENMIYSKVLTLNQDDKEYYLIYNKNDNKLYWGYSINRKFSVNSIEPHLVSFLLTEKIDKPNLNKLLNDLYFEILSSQQDTTSASNTSISSPQAPIEQPLIPPDIAEKLSTITGVRKTLASGLRGFADSLADKINSNSIPQPSTGGSKKTTYRLNGEKVLLLHKNKKVQRSIYVKGNGKTKYCKINKEYVLLSKVKNKIQ